ncbi:phage minor head protein [Acetobacterium tundrae]|nr:phage minor head protein [Acetobacterium tundrae]
MNSKKKNNSESFIDEIKKVPEDVVSDFQNGKSISQCIALLANCENFKGKEKSELREWVYTANSLIINEKSAKYAEENNLKNATYKIITAGNELVCKRCESLSRKKFVLMDRKAGENCPPLHLGCKCAAAIYPEW